MKVFISWSGARSKEVAKILHWWLPSVIQRIDPWMSDEDIRKGSNWPEVIGNQLESSEAGIICVTPEKQLEPWLLFESGALAKRFGQRALLCIYLFGMKKADLKPSPLALYQATESDREDTFKLIATLNEANPEGRVSDDLLQRTFSRWWPDLEAGLDSIAPVMHASDSSQRSERDMLEELLLLQREQARQGKHSVLESDQGNTLAAELKHLSQAVSYLDSKNTWNTATSRDIILDNLTSLRRNVDALVALDEREGEHSFHVPSVSDLADRLLAAQARALVKSDSLDIMFPLIEWTVRRELYRYREEVRFAISRGVRVRKILLRGEGMLVESLRLILLAHITDARELGYEIRFLNSESDLRSSLKSSKRMFRPSLSIFNHGKEALGVEVNKADLSDLRLTREGTIISELREIFDIAWRYSIPLDREADIPDS